MKAATISTFVVLGSMLLLVESLYAGTVVTHRSAQRNYECTNHLGNVLETVSDKKTVAGSSAATQTPNAVVSSQSDYYPFGSPMHDRTAQSSGYRFGFNGMEQDPEAKGAGNHYDFKARMYDPRVGRMISIDPVAHPHQSPFAAFDNNPPNIIDPTGRSGEATVDHDSKRVTVKSHMVFYGGKANKRNARKVSASMQDAWNEPNATVEIDGEQYAVDFEVTWEVVRGSKNIQERIENNGDNTLNNFVRIERIRPIKVSAERAEKVMGPRVRHISSSFKMDHSGEQSVGGNHGFINLYDAKDVTTFAHEFGHSLGWMQLEGGETTSHDGLGYLDDNGKRAPGIMTHRTTSTDAPQTDFGMETGFDDSYLKAGRINPKLRKVTTRDVRQLNINWAALKDQDTIKFGSATNSMVDKIGNDIEPGEE